MLRLQLFARGFADHDNSGACTQTCGCHRFLEWDNSIADVSTMSSKLHSRGNSHSHLCLRICSILISATGITQLVEAHWPSLSQLELFFCKLDADTVSELVWGDWPLLCNLVLVEAPTSSMCLSTGNAERLLDGFWSLLNQLVLSPFDCQAVAYLLSTSRETQQVMVVISIDTWR